MSGDEMRSPWATRNAETLEPQKYGGVESYEAIADAVSGCDVVVDLGGGHGFLGTVLSERDFDGEYLNVDGGGGPHADYVIDLVRDPAWTLVAALGDYTEPAQNLGVVLRHVLEHNHDWREIIANALSLQPDVLVIVLFTPLSDRTHVIAETVMDGLVVPDYSFRLAEIIFYLSGDIETHYLGDETMLVVTP